MEMEKALQANPQSCLELEELKRRLKDTQNMLELGENQLSNSHEQITRLKEVANTMQEHNLKIIGQLTSTTSQLEYLVDSKKQDEAALSAQHAQEIIQLQDQLKVTQKIVKQNERVTQDSNGLQKEVDKKEIKHAKELRILAEEKDLAHKVVNDCLQLLSQSEKEAVMLRHDLSAVQCHISAQVEHGVSTENRHRHIVQRSNQELEHERRERKLLERQLAEITNSVDYLRQAQSLQGNQYQESHENVKFAVVDNVEVERLRIRVQDLTTKNQQLHRHATLKSQECEILQASLKLVSQTDTLSEPDFSQAISIQIQPPLDHPFKPAIGSTTTTQEQQHEGTEESNGLRDGIKGVSTGDLSSGKSESFNTVSKTLREEKRCLHLDDENDAIKMRIVHLVDRLEGQLYSNE